MIHHGKDACTRTVRIVLGDTSRRVRKGLRRLLSTFPEFQVVGEASTGTAVVSLAGRLRPDVVLVGSAMPTGDGSPAAEEIKRLGLPARVVLLTMNDICNGPIVGADVVLSKGCATERLIESIRGNGPTVAQSGPTVRHHGSVRSKEPTP